MVRHALQITNAGCLLTSHLRSCLYCQSRQGELHHGLRSLWYVEQSIHYCKLVNKGDTLGSLLTSLSCTETNSTELIADSISNNTASWSGSLLYITVDNGPVGFYKEGFTNVSTSTIKTTGFKFYGSNCMINIDGTLETLWYAVETAVDGLWSLDWNTTDTGENSTELLSVRKVVAPNVDYPSIQL